MCSSRKTRAAVATFKRRLVACARSRRFRSGGRLTLSGPERFGLTVDFTITTYITTAARQLESDAARSEPRRTQVGDCATGLRLGARGRRADRTARRARVLVVRVAAAPAGARARCGAAVLGCGRAGAHSDLGCRLHACAIGGRVLVCLLTS